MATILSPGGLVFGVSGLPRMGPPSLLALRRSDRCFGVVLGVGVARIAMCERGVPMDW